MDLSTILGALLSDDSVKTVSKKTKSNSSQVQDIVTLALPFLVDGIKSQASNKKTSSSLVKALSDHGKKDATDLGSFLSNVDVADGAKIIGHLLGSKEKDVAKDIAKKTGTDSNQVVELLANIAPLVMTLIGNQATKATKKKAATKKTTTTAKKTTAAKKTSTTAKTSTTKKKTTSKKVTKAKEDDSNDVVASLIGDVIKGLLK